MEEATLPEEARADGRASFPALVERHSREVWARLAPHLDERPRFVWAPRRWAMAGLVAASLARRFSPREQDLARRAEPIQPQVRERVLVVAVEDHLARSQMVLLELMNPAPARQVDIAEEQSRADDLVAANRLYREAAAFILIRVRAVAPADRRSGDCVQGACAGFNVADKECFAMKKIIVCVVWAVAAMHAAPRGER